jgi:1-acyl-sn-glycerol-3-phosphate acyltransferase
MESTQVAQPGGFRQIDIAQLLRTHKSRIARFVPKWLIRVLSRLLHVDELNEFLGAHYTDEPFQFIHEAGKFLELSLQVIGEERLEHALGKRAIVVANHPLGGPESLLLMERVGTYSPQAKMISRTVVMDALAPIAPLLIPIPTPENHALAHTFKQAFKGDDPIVLFPAGYCSRPLSNGVLFDYVWFPTFVKMAKRYGRPIVPVHIDGSNSRKFYRLSSLRRHLGIKASLESLYLIDEMFKQRGKVITMTVGYPIDPAVLDDAETDERWADKIRNHVLLLGKDPQVAFDPRREPVLPLT